LKISLFSDRTGECQVIGCHPTVERDLVIEFPRSFPDNSFIENFVRDPALTGSDR
jgi:hypothetical protein